MHPHRLRTIAGLGLACALLAACGDDSSASDDTSTAGSAGKTSSTAGSAGKANAAGSAGKAGAAAGSSGKASASAGSGGKAGTGGTTQSDDASVPMSQGFVPDYKQSADFTSLAAGRQKGNSPHGYQQTWYSTELAAVLDEDAFKAPVGSVAIKEFSDSADGAVKGFAVMVKREPGYDAANGDWYYEMRMPDGMLMDMPKPGRIADCISCHKGFAATDFLGATKIRVGFMADFQQSSDFTTLAAGRKKGSSPHGYQQTWYSKPLAAEFGKAGFKAPVGSLAIKEFSDSADGAVKGFAVMVKRESGYDPDHNDWYYEMRMPDGTLMDMPKPGRISDCISCHKGFAAMDYLGATEVR